MKPSPMICSREQLDRLLNDDLSNVELAKLESHLSTCGECESTLAKSAAAPNLWRDAGKFLRDHDSDQNDVAGESPETSSNLSGVLQQLLGPTDDPTMMGRFGGYEISGVIGRGGMAIVLKGRDISLDRFVAIKVLDPAISNSSAARRRFVREAQAAAAVIHDNVIAIHGVDHSGDHPFLVMPYVKGESLQQRIDRSGPLGDEDILNISMQIARGLSAAHDQGLVHRDIKPANILMPAGVSRVLLTDFGLARAADDASLTRSGVIAGTPQYMSPEQINGQPVDQRADLFSLGGVMYAMACGHSPFRADTPYAVLKRIVDDPHRSISQVRSDTPRYLVDIIDRLLEKKPDHRFDSAEELADHLAVCLAHVRQPTVTKLPKLHSQLHDRSPRKWLRPTVIGGMMLMLLGFAWSWISKPVPDSIEPTVSVQADPDPTPDAKGWLENTELAELEVELEELLKTQSETFESEN